MMYVVHTYIIVVPTCMSNDFDGDYDNQLLSNSVFIIITVNKRIIYYYIPIVLDLVELCCSAGRHDSRQRDTKILYNI